MSTLILKRVVAGVPALHAWLQLQPILVQVDILNLAGQGATTRLLSLMRELAESRTVLASPEDLRGRLKLAQQANAQSAKAFNSASRAS